MTDGVVAFDEYESLAVNDLHFLYVWAHVSSFFPFFGGEESMYIFVECVSLCAVPVMMIIMW